MTAHRPHWVSAVVDLPAASFEAGLAFWEGVTGFRRSAPTGPHAEWVALEPTGADHHLSGQRIGRGSAGVHLDLHVADPVAAARAAVDAGATVVREEGPGFVVLASPGGYPFCFIDDVLRHPAGVADWGDGLRSAIDQVCLDVPVRACDGEAAFWSAVTGWEVRPHPSRDEFTWLLGGPALPLQLLLQRLGEDDGPVRAHLDVPTSDRSAEVRRHERLGATLVGVHDGWTVLRDPAGSAYCVTDRTPETRMPGRPVGG